MAKPKGELAGGRGPTADRVVLGKYPDQIQVALDSGGVFFDPTEQVLRGLEKAGIDPWRVHEAFLRQQEAAGRQFDTTLQGLTLDEVTGLVGAIPALEEGNLAEALRILGVDRLPPYAQEAQWLLQKRYVAELDIPSGWIRWRKT